MASSYYDSSGKEVVDGNIAYASDLNDINTAVDTGFQLVETAIGAVSTSQVYYADLAEKWATEDEDVEVESGKYSAFHWAQKTEDDATATAADRVQTGLDRTAASNSASAASASASSASNSAISASNSASSASGSEIAAGLSEDSAAISASDASDSADAASISAAAALNSEIAAAASAASMPTIVDGDATKSVVVKSDETGFEVSAIPPTGCIIATANTSVPSGYLECDGSAISRTTYDELFAILGTKYGVGNGSTTFNIPDYRGEFLRGWSHGTTNDPDKATRTNRGDGTTGDNVGTKQSSTYTAHTHSYTITNIASAGSPGGTPFFTATASSNTGSSGGNETRPRNINVIFCIKY